MRLLVLWLSCLALTGSAFAVDRVSVPSDGRPVTLDGLEVGGSYQLRVSGSMTFGRWAATGATLRNDACYEYDAKGFPDPLTVFQNSFDVVVCGLYRSDHVYLSAPFVAPSQRLVLWVFDTDYRDNDGALDVEIIPIASGSAGGYLMSDTCTWAFDGECDEPGIGTGLCLPGTDTFDCSGAAWGPDDSCPWAFDGECDEPGIGTGACLAGTDGFDCRGGAAAPEPDLPADVERREQALTQCDVWSVASSGGVEGTVDRWDVSTIPAGARFDLRFDAHELPDRFRVAYGGAVVYESGWRGDATYASRPAYADGVAGPGAGEVLDTFVKGLADDFTVSVVGADPDTKWDDSVRCRLP